MGAAVLVMARAPRPGQVKTRLEPLLGPEGCARLQAGLVRRAAEWAHQVAPGAAHVAGTPEDGLGELEALVPAGTALFGQVGADLGERLAAATAHVLSAHNGPVLVIGTDLPTLRPAHGAAALDDLAEGCDAVFGPAMDGGYYLVGIARPLPELFALPTEAWGGPDVLSLGLRAAQDLGLEVGLLRPERDLDTPADARAALLDPMLPPDIAELLRRP